MMRRRASQCTRPPRRRISNSNNRSGGGLVNVQCPALGFFEPAEAMIDSYLINLLHENRNHPIMADCLGLISQAALPLPPCAETATSGRLIVVSSVASVSAFRTASSCRVEDQR